MLDLLNKFRKTLKKEKKFRKILYKLKYDYNKLIHSFNYPDGISIFDKKWDILIVLDACRYDSFKNINTIKGNLSPIISKGTHTPDWLKLNFVEPFYENIVYVSANPQLGKTINCRKKFYDCACVFLTDWNSKYRTVMPGSLLSYTIDFNRKYPDKKLIVHYLQPHIPFVGKTKIFSKDSWIWGWVMWGNYPIKKFYKGYEDNLKFVLKHVKKMIPKLRGKIVITSDHGYLFGEYGLYGHPAGVRVPELITVPWFEVKEKEESVKNI